MTMRLKPSDIYYCQDSINNVFDGKSNHRGQFIGWTLDDIVAGRCSIEYVPRIQVCYVNGKWFSADNRRLWVFKNLYSLGKCDTIPVIKVPNILYRKFTTKNGGTSIRVRGDPGGKWHREAEQRRQNKELLDRYKPSSTYSSGQTQVSRNVADINTVFNQLQLEDNIDSRPSGVNIGCGIVKPKQEMRMSNMQNITGVQRNTNCDESVQNFQDHASTITRTNGWTNTNVIETHQTYRERLNVPRIKNEPSRVATWINDDDFSLGKSTSDENTSTNRHNPVDSDRTNIGSHSMNTAKRASYVDRCNEQTVASGVYRDQSDTTGFVRHEQRTSSAKSTIQPCSLATKKTPETDFNKFNQALVSTLKTTSEMEHGNKYSATSYGRETKYGGTSITARGDPGGAWHREAEQRCQNRELLENRYKPSTYSSGKTQVSRNVADINTVFNQLQLEDNIDRDLSGVNVGCGIVKPKQEIQMSNMQNITGVQRNTNCDESVQNFQDHASPITRTNGWTNTNVIETHQTYRERLNVPRIKNEPVTGATWIYDDNFSLRKSTSDENTSTNRHNPVDSDRTNIGSHSMNTAKRASYFDSYEQTVTSSGGYRGKSDTTDLVRHEQMTSSAKSTNQPCSLATKKMPGTNFNRFNQSPFSTLKTTSPLEHRNRYSATGYERPTTCARTENNNKILLLSGSETSAKLNRTESEFTEYRNKSSATGYERPTYVRAENNNKILLQNGSGTSAKLNRTESEFTEYRNKSSATGYERPTTSVRADNINKTLLLSGSGTSGKPTRTESEFTEYRNKSSATGYERPSYVRAENNNKILLLSRSETSGKPTRTESQFTEYRNKSSATSYESPTTSVRAENNKTLLQSRSETTAKPTRTESEFTEYRNKSSATGYERPTYVRAENNKTLLQSRSETSGKPTRTESQFTEYRNKSSTTSYESPTTSVRADNINKTMLQSGSETTAKPTRTESEFTEYRNKSSATGYERPTYVRAENNKTLLQSRSETSGKPTRTESQFTEYRNKSSATGYEKPTYVRAENNNKILLQSGSETTAKPTRTESEFTGFNRSAANSKAVEYNKHSRKVSSNTKTDRVLHPTKEYLVKPPSYILFTEINQNRGTFRTQYVYKQLLLQDDVVISPITLYRYKGRYWALDENDILLAYKMAERHKPDIRVRVTISDNEDEFESIIMKERPLSVALDIITLKLQKFC